MHLRDSSAWRCARNVPLPEGHVAGLMVGVGLQRRRGGRLRGPRWMYRIGGAAALSAGAALAAWAVTTAARVDLDEPDQLVTAGPYARTRNPMYLGWALMHAGVALLSRSPWILATLPPAAVRTYHDARAEERTLEARFGAAYADYRGRVPRLLT